MSALPVVKHLDPLEERPSGLLSIGEHLIAHQFPLDRDEEALGHRVVITIPRQAHARLDPVCHDTTSTTTKGIRTMA